MLGVCCLCTSLRTSLSLSLAVPCPTAPPHPSSTPASPSPHTPPPTLHCFHPSPSLPTSSLSPSLADWAIKDEMVLKLAILAERFAPDMRW